MHYALLVGTNRNKTADEIEKSAVTGIEAVKAKLEELKAGEQVFICGRREGEKPPEVLTREVADHCKKIGLIAQ